MVRKDKVCGRDSVLGDGKGWKERRPFPEHVLHAAVGPKHGWTICPWKTEILRGIKIVIPIYRCLVLRGQ